MGAVAGVGTTYALPNFHGELFVVSPIETPFLSAIGGLHGAKTCDAAEFEWQTIDRRNSTANNSELEGQAAPIGQARSRANVTNLVEIHHSAIEVSYSKQAAFGSYAGANIGAAMSSNELDALDEMSAQTMAELESMAVDIEQSFLTGVYHKPTDNTTARQTRGVLTAISTNVFGNSGTPRALSKGLIDTALRGIFDSGGKLSQESTVLMVGSSQKLALSSVYADPALSQPTMDRTVGGVAIDTIVTDFGKFGVMLNRWMPAGKLAIIDLSLCKPVFLEIPGKGLLFVERLGRLGAVMRYQLYGEVGLQYGPENAHALITDLA